MMARKKKEEVEVPLLHKIPEARYFLAKYVANFQTAKALYDSHSFDMPRDSDSEPVFKILDVLEGPEIPDGLPADEYFVIKTVRKFRVTEYKPAHVYTTKELKP